ncbi:uncharacterized protein LOC110392710 [Numida meleagris]|uniref:uncharacterized protein LOC110392710 n=1 Tax=Numida meleagris TaxID=8996 RepID=UPI000B3D9666|nr:uncharacterized protein LOC110392710 [Numida meleagris]
MHIMSERKRKASGSEEPACVLCGRADADPAICGRTFDQSGIRVHEFCLMFAHIDFEDRPTPEGNVGLPLAAIGSKAKQANQKQCCVCGERGAAITCAESGCERSFHLPCAADGECVTQFYGQFRSFCWEHRPQQAIEEAPAEDTNCLICMETVGDRLSYYTLVCPACTHAWFHRGCIQQHAMNAGFLCFQCPSCRDKFQFLMEMFSMGIQIPARLVSVCPALHTLRLKCWACPETVSAGLALCCLRSMCLSFTENFLLLTFLPPLTASRDNAELAGPSTASQRGLEPSNGSLETDNFSSRPASQAALGPPHDSQLPEHSDQPSERGTEQRTNCPRSRDNQASTEQRRGRRGSGRSGSGRSGSRRRGSGRSGSGRRGSRRRGSRRCGSRRRGSRRAAAPRAQSSSRTSTRRRTPGSSRASSAATRRRRPRQQGRSRTRSRSPLQGRAPRSQSRPRRHHGSRQRPAPRDQSRTRSSARSATSRSSRASSVPQRRGRSTQ